MDKHSPPISSFPATGVGGGCSPRDLVDGLPAGSQGDLDAVRRELAEAIDRVEEVLKRFETLTGGRPAREAECGEDGGEEDAEESGLISEAEAQSFVQVEPCVDRRPPLDPALASGDERGHWSLDPDTAADLDRALAEAFEEAGELPGAAGSERGDDASGEDQGFPSSAPGTGRTASVDDGAHPPLGPVFLFKPATTSPPAGEGDDQRPAASAGKRPPEPEGTVHMQFKNGGYTSAWLPSSSPGVPPPPPSVLGFSSAGKKDAAAPSPGPDAQLDSLAATEEDNDSNGSADGDVALPS